MDWEISSKICPGCPGRLQTQTCVSRCKSLQSIALYRRLSSSPKDLKWFKGVSQEETSKFMAINKTLNNRSYHRSIELVGLNNRWKEWQLADKEAKEMSRMGRGRTRYQEECSRSRIAAAEMSRDISLCFEGQFVTKLRQFGDEYSDAKRAMAKLENRRSMKNDKSTEPQLARTMIKGGDSSPKQEATSTGEVEPKVEPAGATETGEATDSENVDPGKE